MSTLNKEEQKEKLSTFLEPEYKTVSTSAGINDLSHCYYQEINSLLAKSDQEQYENDPKGIEEGQKHQFDKGDNIKKLKKEEKVKDNIQKSEKKPVCLNNYIGLYNDGVISYTNLNDILVQSETESIDQLINLYFCQPKREHQMGLDFINKLRQLFNWDNTKTSNNTDSKQDNTESLGKARKTEDVQQIPSDQTQQNYQKRKRRYIFTSSYILVF